MIELLTMQRIVALPESATHVRVMLTPGGRSFLIDYGSPRGMANRDRTMYSHAGEPGYSQAVLTREEGMVMARTMLADTPTDALRRLAAERDEWKAQKADMEWKEGIARLIRRQQMENRERETARQAMIRRNQDRLIELTRNKTRK